MSKGGNRLRFQKLLPNYADVTTTLNAKYNKGEEPTRHETMGLDDARQVKATYKEIEETIIPIFKNNENVRARFDLVMSMINQVQSHSIEAFEGQEMRPDILSDFAKADIQGYENVKRDILKASDLSPEIIQRITKLIDKLIDYVNTIFGIAINKPDGLEEAVNQIDIEDFSNNLYGTVLAFIFGLVSILVGDYNEEKLSKVLALGMTCSERIESYVDTIDILSNSQNLESINQSEKYYNLE